jgi:hypothetical protein
LQRRATITAQGNLEEDIDTVLFTEDGHSDTLHWTGWQGQYMGHENHLEGEATGEQIGCAFHWNTHGLSRNLTASPPS